MADIARLALQIDVTGARRAQQALKGLQDGSIRATRVTDQLTASTQRMATTTRRTAGAFRLQKGALQQAGFQIQDFAVQVGSGQSALVAFGQQGSQLAGILGPGGALIGAVIAIGSVVGGIFARSMMQGSDSTEDLTEKTRELVEELGRATERQREFINTGFAQEMAEQERAVRNAERNIEVLNGRLEDFRRSAGENVPDAVFESNSAVKSLREEMEQARLVIDNAESSTEAIAKAQKEFWEEVEKTGEKTEETTNELEEMVSALQAQAETVGMSARETALYEANRLGANQADREAINNAFDQIEAEKQRQEQIKETQNQEQALQKLRSDLDPAGAEFTRYADQIDAIEQFNISAAEKDRLREEAFKQHQERMSAIAGEGGTQIAESQGQSLQLLTDYQSNALGTFSQIFGNMADIAEKGGKDQFDTWKAMAKAQAVVSTALAATNALTAGPILGPILATTIAGLGAVNLAQIEATEYQSARAMGGQVQAGSSYLVGERGPEVVTMGGTGMVTPNHKMGGGNSANVTQVFQLSDNARREAKQQILESAPMIQQMAKQAVLQAINQGGAMSRAVGRRS